jgi:hypothetical protein
MGTKRVSSVLFFCVGAGVTAACATGGDELAGLLDTGTTMPMVDDGGDGASRNVDAPSFSNDGAHTTTDAPADAATDASKMGTEGGGSDAPLDAGVDAPVDTGVDAAKDASADTGTDAMVPTTCKEADDDIGCCVGDVLYYCVTTTLTKQTCKGTKVCGWSKADDYYACVAPPGGADPSGTYPIACK